jgi:hypothetical protein
MITEGKQTTTPRQHTMAIQSVTFIPATTTTRVSAGNYTVFANWYGTGNRPYEFYIIKDGSKWFIYAEQHDERDFEQSEFKSLADAKAYLEPFAEHFSECCMDNMTD